MKSSPSHWHCPLCSYPGVKHPVLLDYGKTCPHRTSLSDCPFAALNGLHAAGRFYEKPAERKAKGLGISEIANSEE